jgi:hypothetical protein
MTVPLLIGLAAGILSGFLGIGGATIIIPALVYVYKTTQHTAQGTAIFALLLPVGLLAVLKYWQAGNVNIKLGLLIALGFFLGAGLGAVLVQGVPDPLVKKIFAVFLMLIALQMLIF